MDYYSVCPIDFCSVTDRVSLTELNDELLACICRVSVIEVDRDARSQAPLVQYLGVSAKRAAEGCYSTGHWALMSNISEQTTYRTPAASPMPTQVRILSHHDHNLLTVHLEAKIEIPRMNRRSPHHLSSVCW